MSLTLYMDMHVHRAVTEGLRRRGVDVLTAQQDGAGLLPDDELLDRATELGRVLFSQDQDLLQIAGSRQQGGGHFAGLIFAHQSGATIGNLISDLELLAKGCTAEDLADRIENLPL